jgi:hypothetical protein
MLSGKFSTFLEEADMRNLLALGAAGVLGFAGIGWYLGWYKVQTTPAADGHRTISIEVDTTKIKKDVNRGEEKVHDYLAKDNQSTSNSTPTPGTAPTSGTPTGFQRGDGGLVYPGTNDAPPPLPPPTIPVLPPPPLPPQ